MKFKRIIALILAVWLPLFSGNALAVALSMETTCQMHAMHGQGTSAVNQEAGMSCHACGFCHLAATGYLAVSHAMPASPDLLSMADSPNPSAFSSISSPPLVPPPLASL